MQNCQMKLPLSSHVICNNSHVICLKLHFYMQNCQMKMPLSSHVICNNSHVICNLYAMIFAGAICQTTTKLRRNDYMMARVPAQRGRTVREAS